MRLGVVRVSDSGEPNEITSGPIQFGNDWRGLYISAADCIELLDVLRFTKNALLNKSEVKDYPAMLEAISTAIQRGVCDTGPFSAEKDPNVED